MKKRLEKHCKRGGITQERAAGLREQGGFSMDSISNMDHIDNRFTLVAAQLIRTARLELIGAPPRIMRREYNRIANRLSLIDTTKDAAKLLHAIEDVLLKNITMNLSGTSCLNCVSFHDCQEVKEVDPVSCNADELPTPYPYEADAKVLCSGYEADWDKFDKAAEIFPEILLRVEASLGIPLDRNKIAGKILGVMGRWVKEVRR